MLVCIGKGSKKCMGLNRPRVMKICLFYERTLWMALYFIFIICSVCVSLENYLAVKYAFLPFEIILY